MRVLYIFLMILTCVVAQARPAYPGVLYATMEDGTRVAYRVVGDEFHHACVTLEGRYIEAIETTEQAPEATLWRYIDQPHQADESAEGESSALLYRAENRYTSFPTLGEVKGLVLLVNFTDKKFYPNHTVELLDRQFNEVGYSDNGATGSARDYFLAQSSGLFQPHFDVVGPVELPQPMAYYGANQGGQDIRPGQMIVDACQYAHDSLGVDFSQYDFDENGEVDFVFCLYAGYGESSGAPSSTIWPHMSMLHSQFIYCTLDGKDINLYACSCELRNTYGSELDGIGAVCHEFGHCLGLPDIYNTRDQGNVQLGSWCVMDSGSYNNYSRTPASYTSFERHQLGWLDFIELTEPQDSVVVPEITENNIAYRITTPGNPNEFFTLENHQQVGWDRGQGGRGLMIIHVTYQADAWNGNYVNSSTYPHYDLVEADGTQGYSLETDLYPTRSNRMFTDYSKPNSLSWSGELTEQPVTNIQQHEDGNISFRFMNDRLARPVLLPVAEVTDTSFCARWEAVAGAKGYRLNLLEEVPDSLNRLLLSEDFSLITGEVSSKDNIANQINDYVHTSGWSGQNLYASNGMVRLGGYGVSGTLTTPRLQNQPGEGITVSLHGCAYTGKSVNYDVIVMDRDNHQLQKQSFKATRQMQTPMMRFGNLPEVFRIHISTNKERLFIDELRIGRGDLDSLQLWSAGPREWAVECSAEEALTPDEPEVCSYTVTGLLAGRTYQYYLTALDPEPLRNSVESETVVVTVLEECGIEDVHVDSEPSGRVYDLQGRPVNAAAGMVISNGRVVFLRR